MMLFDAPPYHLHRRSATTHVYQSSERLLRPDDVNQVAKSSDRDDSPGS